MKSEILWLIFLVSQVKTAKRFFLAMLRDAQTQKDLPRGIAMLLLPTLRKSYD